MKRKPTYAPNRSEEYVHSSLSDKELYQALRELGVSMGSLETVMFIQEEIEEITGLLQPYQRRHRYLIEEYASKMLPTI